MPTKRYNAGIVISRHLTHSRMNASTGTSYSWPAYSNNIRYKLSRYTHSIQVTILQGDLYPRWYFFTAWKSLAETWAANARRKQTLC